MRLELGAFAVLTRAHFLLGGIVMYGLGMMAAYNCGAVLRPARLLWGQLGVTAIQLVTHFINEYYDVERDALVVNPTLFSGGSRILPAGRLPMGIAVRAAWVCACVGLAVTLTVGWPALPIYGAAVVIGYGYSAPPLHLMTRGLGEPAAASTVALLTPLAGYSVALGRVDGYVLLVILPLLALSLAFMIAVELPDYEADRPTGKRNWVVRLGRRRAGVLHNGFLLAAYSLLALIAASGCVPAPVVSLLWLTLPLAVWQAVHVGWGMQQGWHHYGWLAAGDMALIGLYGLLGGLGHWLALEPLPSGMLTPHLAVLSPVFQ
jgi:1,4-dihydroxy-2-naphthoate octaprenyltransferase